MSYDVQELTAIDPPGRDPAELGWPPTLAVEVALRDMPIHKICDAYNIDRTQWDRIKAEPGFIAEVAGAIEALKTEGMSFKMKARLQAEELLKTSWKMIHNVENPAAVRADLLKFTIKAAGLSEEKAQAQVGNALQININLG